MKLRKALVSDAKEIATIQIQTWKKAYSGLMPDAFLKQYHVTEEIICHWQELIAESEEFFWVAENSDGRIVGYLQAGPGRFDHVPYAVEIYSFYILPEFQNQGLGKKLFKTFWEKQENLSCFACAVKGNFSAKNFYQRVGGILQSEYEFVSSTNNFPVTEEVYVWGKPVKEKKTHQPGSPANPKFW